MNRRSLADWLAWQETLHPAGMDLGLERVREVAGRLALPRPAGGILTIAGTNGKGSTLRFAEAALAATGRRTGAYSSPHLLHYNERIRVDGQPASDARLVAAFEAVERARAGTSLTYFEFGTLAAAWLFADAGADLWLLEVGLGGRLDAVNVFDPDVSLITGVALDHEHWLGSSRERIAAEKAGIMRTGRPVFFGSTDVPDAILRQAATLNAKLGLAGREFGWRLGDEGLDWWLGNQCLPSLARPWPGDSAQLDNLALALAGVAVLSGEQLPRAAAEAAIRAGNPPGRFQRVSRDHSEWILDVAHNPQAMALLAQRLHALPPARRTLIVLALLADKDADACLRELAPLADAWIVCRLDGARARPADELATLVSSRSIAPLQLAGSPAEACALVASGTGAGDRVVVCGSFLLVGPVLDWLGLYS